MQARPAELTVEQNAQRMGRDLAIQARHEMPQVTGAVALDLKSLAQLAYNRLDQTARASGPAHEAARTVFFHIAAQWRVQLNALACQVLLENGADKAFVAQQHAFDSRQVHVNERIALIHVGAKQGDVLNHPFPAGE